MPEMSEELFMESLEALVSQDERWVPSLDEQSLYLRPFMISTEVGLGIRPANSYAFLLIACPVGAYFPQGVKPVTVWISTEYVRAAPGGTGEAKCAGNYAASLVAQMQAAEQGCDQVVWIDAIERKWVEEMGGMNMYFVYGSGPEARIMTPELTGTLLPGVTRDSILTLAADLGYKAETGHISVDEWRAAAESGEITEVFACGTAAAITPVGHVKSAAGEWTNGDGQPGEVTMKLREALLGIQSGKIQDTHNWMTKLA
jgi:branched-chain amino acid aminotransferase